MTKKSTPGQTLSESRDMLKTGRARTAEMASELGGGKVVPRAAE